MDTADLEQILQSEAVEAILRRQEFRAGGLSAKWADNNTRYVVFSYRDEIAYFDIEWHVHWHWNASGTTLRHTRIANRAAKEWAHRHGNKAN